MRSSRHRTDPRRSVCGASSTGGDLVIVDMFMPDKDGLETIIELRAYSPGIPIIAISGGGATGRVDILGDAKLLGAVETIKKPFSTNALLALVARSLANSGRGDSPNVEKEMGEY